MSFIAGNQFLGHSFTYNTVYSEPLLGRPIVIFSAFNVTHMRISVKGWQRRRTVAEQ